ncbi:MAG: hypothetical protein K2I72_00190, partial [Bacilli bacterium]|nr:hypothetical protein [Bacilli bacterium]
DGVKINGIPYEGFSPNTYEYNIELPTNLNYIHLEAIKHITGQTVVGEEKYEFNENETTLTLLSISEDGSENQLYTFHFTRKRTSLLKAIISPIPLGFTSTQFEYDIEMLDTIYSLELETEIYFEGTVVTITGNKFIDDGKSDIVVTSHLDGVEDTVYIIHVNKKSSIDGVGEDFDHVGDPIEYIVPYSGYYEIQLWGAGAGKSAGGYTKGKIKLFANERLYFYLGGQGMKCTEEECTPGWNGGGESGYYGTAGGNTGNGATDVRLSSGSWNNAESLKTRIMVAGGGGGQVSTYPGAAGGLNGYHGYTSGASSYGGYGATQIAGGKAASKYKGTVGTITAGIFGSGGNGNQAKTSGYGSGGGGGYYGGGGGSGKVTAGYPGGGGSSFISGHAGSIAIKEDGTPVVSKYSNIENSYHYSGRYFTETKMIDGKGYNW